MPPSTPREVSTRETRGERALVVSEARARDSDTLHPEPHPSRTPNTGIAMNSPPSTRQNVMRSSPRDTRWQQVFESSAEQRVEASEELFGAGRIGVRRNISGENLGLLGGESRSARASKNLDEALLGGKDGGGGGKDADPLAAAFKALLYGLINTIVVTPVMIGFAAIIFRHESFRADPEVYAQLVKLVVFSSAVHQAAFTTTSSLPFAIGQVQDAGLIFLSKIASEIAEEMINEPREAMVATVLVTLSLSTALLGVALIITGKCRLASLVQYLPLPVVGGYLAFIGLYCLEAGLSMMSGEAVDSLIGLKMVEQWRALLTPTSLYYTLPGVTLGVGLLMALQRFHHFLVRPGAATAVPRRSPRAPCVQRTPLNTSLRTVRAAAGAAWAAAGHPARLLRPDGLHGLEPRRDAPAGPRRRGAAPGQPARRLGALRLLARALGAAAARGPHLVGHVRRRRLLVLARRGGDPDGHGAAARLQPRAHDGARGRRARSSAPPAAGAPPPAQARSDRASVVVRAQVGLSNFFSGLTGGFTGSYIFSQTLFTFRTGTRSRLCGGFVFVASMNCCP